MSYYCKPTRDERTKINRALDRWGAFEFFKDKGLMIQKDDKKKVVVVVYLVTDRIEELMMRIHMMQPFSLGLAIGELKSSSSYNSRGRPFCTLRREEQVLHCGR